MHHAYLDKFAYQDSPVHRLDSRVKFIALVVFTIAVISLPRTSVSILLCYAVGPFAVLVLGGIPLQFALKQILLVSPFVAVLALSCPFYDKAFVPVYFGPYTLEISQGWLRCFAILGKFAVTMLSLIALVSTTRFSNLLVGLQKLGAPKLLVIQLGFLYRYIFVLIDMVQHMLRARTARKLRSLGFKQEFKTASAMVGSILVRSIDTAENINIAMQGRGFDGRWHSLNRLQIRSTDWTFAVVACGFLLTLEFFIKPILI
jgi:cobalt/nickel transport system permease protein